MTDPQGLLGAAESESREFKSAKILDEHPSRIAREVVAFLNHGPGELWIGVREEGGRAVAIEPIERADHHVKRLVDSFVDSIEPHPAKDELSLEVVQIGDMPVLRIEVKPVERSRPYALVRGTARHFLTRIADRIRPLSREEIRDFFIRPGGPHENQADGALSDVLRLRLASQKAGGARMWMCIQPTSVAEIDVQAASVGELLRRPEISGNRAAGWNPINPYATPELRQGKISQAGATIHRNGRLVLDLPLDRLHWKGAEDEIYPFALLEYTVSLFRIARALYRNQLAVCPAIVADLALFGARSWRLRPYSPRAFRYGDDEAQSLQEDDDLVLIRPYRFSSEDLEASPDMCAYRLVTEVYEAYGLDADTIPAELDPEQGQLRFDD